MRLEELFEKEGKSTNDQYKDAVSRLKVIKKQKSDTNRNVPDSVVAQAKKDVERLK